MALSRNGLVRRVARDANARPLRHIRTSGNPLRSRPSLPLPVTAILVVLIGVALPFTPLADTLGFVPLLGTYFAFLGGVTITYLSLVELVKRRLMQKLLGKGTTSMLRSNAAPSVGENLAEPLSSRNGVAAMAP